jgi:hypothetical protein
MGTLVVRPIVVGGILGDHVEGYKLPTLEPTIMSRAGAFLWIHSQHTQSHMAELETWQQFYSKSHYVFEPRGTVFVQD